MSNYTFNYAFNITGNCSAAVVDIAENVDELNRKIKDTTAGFEIFQSTIFKINQATQYIENLNQSFQNTIAPGVALESSLADLSAISGVTGEGLADIERKARATAKEFGGSAAQAVESYKLLLSQLSPELAKTPAAMQEMGRNIAILSKTMGGDATAAATVLTTAMNQYGVSLEDPMEASRKMAEMMNIMAAAGKEGSAELPTIQVALQQCGMMAKSAGVSFAETNAAIQVLDKAGKKGAEGGVALRNVMSILAQGRFLPKDVREELEAAGVDINLLTDKTKSLSERLRPLQPLMADSALFTKLFGRENSAAATALVQGIDQVEAWTTAITGTNTAVEQSEVIMETYSERLSRIQARFDDIKISIFNATGDFGIWLSVISQSLIPIAQLVPLISGLVSAARFIAPVFVRAYTSLGMFNGYLSIGRVQSLGFIRNIVQATVATARFATVGLIQGLKALGSFVLSLITGGTASATFATIASTSFGAFKVAAVTACKAVGIAIKNIPVIGWIIAIVSAVISLIGFFWRTSAKFRGIMKGTGAFIVALLKGLWTVASEVLSGIANAIWKVVTFQWDEVGDQLNRIPQAFANYGKSAAQAFTNAYQEEVEAAEKKVADSKADATAEFQMVQGDINALPTDPVPSPIAGTLGGIGGGAESMDRIKNINVTIEKVIDSFTIETTNMQESKERIRDMVAEVLVSAINDINYAV